MATEDNVNALPDIVITPPDQSSGPPIVLITPPELQQGQDHVSTALYNASEILVTPTEAIADPPNVFVIPPEIMIPATVPPAIVLTPAEPASGIPFVLVTPPELPAALPINAINPPDIVVTPAESAADPPLVPITPPENPAALPVLAANPPEIVFTPAELTSGPPIVLITPPEFPASLPAIPANPPDIVVTFADEFSASAPQASPGRSPPSLDLAAEGVLATAAGSQLYSGSLGQGDFCTHLLLTQHPDYSCCKWLEAFFDLTIGDERKTIGHAIAYVVDRSDRPTFAEQLLSSDSNATELTRMMRTLYDTSGELREPFASQSYIFGLTADTLCHIDKLVIEADFRNGKGFGKLALESLHQLLPLLDNGHVFSGTVVLSPAVPEGFDEEYQHDGLTMQQKEGKLIRFYSNCGYELYVRGTRCLDGSITAMGRTAGGAERRGESAGSEMAAGLGRLQW